MVPDPLLHSPASLPGQGRQFINEKKSVLTAAFEAGKEAIKKERAI
jgi:hypothetical protein